MKQSLGKISDLDSISITEYDKDNLNLHSMVNSETGVVTSESYKNIINQAKKLNNNRISSNYNNLKSLRGGSLIVSENSDANDSFVQKYGDFSSTSSAFMTEIMGSKQVGGGDLSATSSAFMTEINKNKQMGVTINDISTTSSADFTGGDNNFSATSSAFMTEIMKNNNVNQNIDVSSTSDAFLTELMGGARKKAGKKPVKKSVKAGDEPKKAESEEESSEEDSSSSPISSSSDEEETSEEISESSEEVGPNAGFVNGTRYLLSETSVASETDMTTSSLSTEDLRFFRK